jgi:hypothetical protein
MEATGEAAPAGLVIRAGAFNTTVAGMLIARYRLGRWPLGLTERPGRWSSMSRDFCHRRVKRSPRDARPARRSSRSESATRTRQAGGSPDPHLKACRQSVRTDVNAGNSASLRRDRAAGSGELCLTIGRGVRMTKWLCDSLSGTRRLGASLTASHSEGCVEHLLQLSSFQPSAFAHRHGFQAGWEGNASVSISASSQLSRP